jgi:UDP-N-acetylglucosamine:LPS N-acetylglucosamine transferase
MPAGTKSSAVPGCFGLHMQSMFANQPHVADVTHKSQCAVVSCCVMLLQWMAAVDTIITKAGPGTIAEALISGLPILLNGNVPCQVRAELGWCL